ncbi:MAG: 30S ribosomal protein S15 [Gammaproteobacteria bacterium]|nr:30S ribosomal protein S15 [Gammaproteobacteria bacterium]
MEASKKIETIRMYQRSENDTASPEVQVALLTQRINYLAGHFKTHVKDHHSKRGLLRMINLRRKLLNYLKSKNVSSYLTLIKRLELRK